MDAEAAVRFLKRFEGSHLDVVTSFSLDPLFYLQCRQPEFQSARRCLRGPPKSCEIERIVYPGLKFLSRDERRALGGNVALIGGFVVTHAESFMKRFAALLEEVRPRLCAFDLKVKPTAKKSQKLIDEIREGLQTKHTDIAMEPYQLSTFGSPFEEERWLLLVATGPMASSATAKDVLKEVITAGQTSFIEQDGDLLDKVLPLKDDRVKFYNTRVKRRRTTPTPDAGLLCANVSVVLAKFI